MSSSLIPNSTHSHRTTTLGDSMPSTTDEEIQNTIASQCSSKRFISGHRNLPSIAVLPALESAQISPARTLRSSSSSSHVGSFQHDWTYYKLNAPIVPFNRSDQGAAREYSPPATLRMDGLSNAAFPAQFLSSPPSLTNSTHPKELLIVRPFGLASDIISSTPPHIPVSYQRTSISSTLSSDSCTSVGSNSSSQPGSPVRSDFISFYSGRTMLTSNTPSPPPAQYRKIQPYQQLSTAMQRSGGQIKHFCKYLYCGWSFKRYEHLKRHMLVHTGERPHVCQFAGCGKTFSRPDNFAAHYRTHNKKSLLQRRLAYGIATARQVDGENEIDPDSAAQRPPQMIPEILRLNLNGIDHGNYNFMEPFEGNQCRQKVTSAKSIPYFSPPYSPYKSIITNSNSNSSSSIYMLLNEDQDRSVCTPNVINRPSTPTKESHLASQSKTIQLEFNAISQKPTTQSLESRNIYSTAILTRESHQRFEYFYHGNASKDTGSSTDQTDSNLSSSATTSKRLFKARTNLPTHLTSMNSQDCTTASSSIPTPSLHENQNSTSISPRPYVGNVAPQSSPSSPSSSSSADSFATNQLDDRRSCTTTQKNHMCTVPNCLKRFKRLEHLKRHQRTHTLERPFECSFAGCRKTFSRNDNLAQHIKIHER